MNIQIVINERDSFTSAMSSQAEDESDEDYNARREWSVGRTYYQAVLTNLDNAKRLILHGPHTKTSDEKCEAFAKVMVAASDAVTRLIQNGEIIPLTTYHEELFRTSHSSPWIDLVT